MFSKLSAHCYPAKEASSAISWLNVNLSNLMLWDIEFRINKHHPPIASYCFSVCMNEQYCNKVTKLERSSATGTELLESRNSMSDAFRRH